MSERTRTVTYGKLLALYVAAVAEAWNRRIEGS